MNLEQKLSKKLKKTGGFTLIEMLIVVAIIAILVAVSIPLVSSSLDKARMATDAANERAAKAAALIEYMTNGKAGKFYYNASTGELAGGGTSDTATDQKYGQCSDHKEQYLQIEITDTGDINLKWSGATGGYNTGLDSDELMNPTDTTPGDSGSGSSST